MGSREQSHGHSKVRGQDSEEKDAAGETGNTSEFASRIKTGQDHRNQVKKEFQEGGSGQLCPVLLR